MEKPVSNGFPHKAKRRIEALTTTLRTLVERDPEQEVRGIAISVLDAVFNDIKSTLGDDPVVTAVEEIISPERIEAGEPIRAADALLVAEQLNAAIGQTPARVYNPAKIRK